MRSNRGLRREGEVGGEGSREEFKKRPIKLRTCTRGKKKKKKVERKFFRFGGRSWKNELKVQREKGRLESRG